MAQFRKSKKVGPFRLTASKSGLSISGGVKGARISANTKGEVRRTVGLPGTGIYDTKRIKGGGANGGGAQEGGDGSSSQELNMQVIEATRGTRALLSNTPGVDSAQIVDLTGDASDVADFAGVETNPNGFRRGIRDAILTPSAGEVQVIVIATIADNDKLFSRKEKNKPDDATPKGERVGRLNKRSATAMIGKVGEQNVHAVVYVDATPGMPGLIEARWFAEDLELEDDEQPPPPAPLSQMPPPPAPLSQMPPPPAPVSQMPPPQPLDQMQPPQPLDQMPPPQPLDQMPPPPRRN